MKLVEEFELGLDAPICITWELTYACNLACVHCLSSSGRRDPRELTTAEAKSVIEELERMQVFYVNIGGGEADRAQGLWELLDHAAEHHVGVKFSTNGSRIDGAAAARLAASDYVDVQVSIDGATAAVNDAVRGPAPSTPRSEPWSGSPRRASRSRRSRRRHRHNAGQLDEFKAIADRYGAQLRITPAAPVGPRRRRLGRAPPDRRPAALSIYVVAGARRGGPHRRLLLPPLRLRRGPCRG